MGGPGIEACLGMLPDEPNTRYKNNSCLCLLHGRWKQNLPIISGIHPGAFAGETPEKLWRLAFFTPRMAFFVHLRTLPLVGLSGLSCGCVTFAHLLAS